MTPPLALVVEDDRQLSFIFSEALRKAGFEVVVVHDGKAAIEQLASIVPFMILLDLHLPYFSGGELLEHIRTTDRLKGVQVILATANAQLAESIRNKADLVLLKPISFSQLQNLAERLHPGK